ncbi:MAG: alpha/beta hydrolase [Myxococcota bacterium]
MPSRWKVAALVAGIVLVGLLVAGFAFRSRTLEWMLHRQQHELEAALNEHDTLQTERGSIHRYAGGDGRVLVLIHGFGDRAGGWAQVAPTLAERYRVVSLDLPGHGASDPASPPLQLQDLTSGLEAALADQGDQLVLLGNSLGGWLALNYALDHPERVDHVVLLNAAGASWWSGPSKKRLLLPTTRDEQREKLAAVLGERAPAMPGFLLDQLVALGNDSRHEDLWNDVTDGNHYLDERLPSLIPSTTMLWGTPDPFFPFDSYATRLSQELPNTELHTLEGCGHAPQYSCPEELASLVFQVVPP